MSEIMIKMAERIIKDIRFYESDNQNVTGKSMPQDLGTLFIPTKDTNHIGQRIARKLNELKFNYGEFDHIYINLSAFLEENEIVISNRDIDSRIKYIDFGINIKKFNSLLDIEKDDCIKSLTFKVLKEISSGLNLEIVHKTEKLISEFDTEIKIHFKTKETSAYRIDIYYQIESLINGTKAILEYKDKTNNLCFSVHCKLQFYEDICSLIDTISLTSGEIVLKPKKSYRADISNERYRTPITFKLSDLKKSHCQ